MLVTACINKEPKIEITDNLREKFICAVINNQPFELEGKIGPLILVFISPSIDDSYALTKITENYEDHCIVATLKEVKKNDEIIYKMDTSKSLGERLDEFNKIFNATVNYRLIINCWYRLYKIFESLMEEALDPNFFQNIESKGN